MIEAVVPGLILASVSGLAFLSYKHHAGYQLLARPLKYAAWAVVIAADAYSLGFTNEKYRDDGEPFFAPGWLTLGMIAFWVYIGCLDFLPHLTRAPGEGDVSDGSHT